jgi:excisionase family DNA binding protein
VNRFYSTKDIAELCGVHITTVIRWVDSGELTCYRTPGGRRRIAADEVRKFIQRLGIPTGTTLSRRRPLVLVVDDDPLVLRTAARQLDASDRFDTLTASSGYDGLLLVGCELPEVVCLDLRMPGVDGFEVCNSIKRTEATRHIQIIGMTGDFTDDVRSRLVALGARACLPKEVALAALVRYVEEAVS